MRIDKKQIRQLYYDYRSELVFGLVLSVLTALSFWLAIFIPEDFYNTYIDPAMFLSMSVGCFWCGWLMLRHLDGNILRSSWAGVLFTWGIIEGGMLILKANGVNAVGGTPDDPLYNASVVMGNILAWLLFVYPSQVLRPGWLNWWRVLIQVLPMIALGVLDYVCNVNLLPFILLFPLWIFFATCAHIRKYKQWCEDNFSSMDSIDVQWIVRYLIMIVLAGVNFYIVCTCFFPNRLFTQQWFLFFILMYTTEQILFRPNPWQKLLQNSASEDEDQQADDNQANDVPVQRATLEQWMEQDKPYLNPDFQLMDLRKVLPMNRTYISQFINTEFGCSFYHFVNQYRIDEAKRLMADSPDMKIADVAARSGFSSRTVFSSTFTKIVGVSPSEWSKQQTNNEG